MVCELDFIIKKKDTLEFSLIVRDGTGTIINLTGYNAKAIALKKLGQLEPDIEVNGQITPAEGLITITFSSDDTNIDPNKYFLGIILEKDDGSFRQTIKDGYLTIEQGFL